MKNTHHAEMRELLIGKNLAWIDAPIRVREEPERRTKSGLKPAGNSTPRRRSE
jgi:hypothetical protein